MALLGLGSTLQAQTSIVPFGAPISITAAQGELGGRPAIATDGTNFLVVWRDPGSGNVRGARVSPGGTVLDANGIAIGNGSGPPSVAFDGSNYLVVWENAGEILGARVGTDGSVLDNPAKQITTGANSKVRPTAIAFGGGSYLIGWRDQGDGIQVARVATDATIVDGPAGFNIGHGFYPWAAYDGSNYIVVWHDNGNGLDVRGHRIGANGASLGGFTITAADGDQDHSSVACSPSNCLVVWHDGPNSFTPGVGAFAARVASDNSILDTTPIKVADGAVGQSPVVVTFDGTDYLVVWQEAVPVKFRLTDVFGRRVSVAGGVVDQTAVPVATTYGHQVAPKIAYNADTYLVAWNEGSSGGRCPGGCVYGQTLEAQAVPPGVVVFTQPQNSANATWVSEPSPTGLPIQAVYAVDATTAYAVTEGGGAPILRFDGNSWSVWISGPFRDHQYGVWSTGPNDVWTVGWCGDFFHYDGQVLQSSNCQPMTIGFGVWGSDPTNILAVGTHGAFGRFDGVVPTQQSTVGVDVSLWDVWGFAANNVYAVGEKGMIFRYDGNNFAALGNLPTKQSLNSVWGAGPNDIYAVGDSGTILRYDGASWSLQNSGTLEHLFGVWGFASNNVYAVGFNGTILHYDGVSWTPEMSGTTQHLLDVGGGGNQLWVVGNNGTILSSTVTLPAPTVNPAGVVSGASFMLGAGVAPGSITSVFGTNLASFTDNAASLPLPTTLGGATMQFNGAMSVPKFFSSPLQVNVQIPWELAGQASAALTDTVGGATSAPENVPLAPFSPGLFSTSQNGMGQGAILIANTPNLAAPQGAFPGSRPAVRGVDFLEIYCTGLGPVTNQPATGAAASANPLSHTLTTPQVTIGGVPATVLFSGLAPPYVGLYVVTLQVPTGTPTGNAVPVVLTIGGISSNTVTIAVE
ncbi:MAG TPA: hypothetical protein VNN18_01505 [Candidatus Xenobia bacterium]|nr:hypothetical protein [Candidatus Xenobia bacterium]